MLLLLLLLLKPVILNPSRRQARCVDSESRSPEDTRPKPCILGRTNGLVAGLVQLEVEVGLMDNDLFYSASYADNPPSTKGHQVAWSTMISYPKELVIGPHYFVLDQDKKDEGNRGN